MDDQRRGPVRSRPVATKQLLDRIVGSPLGGTDKGEIAAAPARRLAPAVTASASPFMGRGNCPAPAVVG